MRERANYTKVARLPASMAAKAMSSVSVNKYIYKYDNVPMVGQFVIHYLFTTYEFKHAFASLAQ